MSKVSHNQALASTLDLDQEFQNRSLKQAITPTLRNSPLSSANRTKGEDLARNLLNANLAPTSEWGCDLDVSDRVVRAWTVGERNIPSDRIDQIIAISKKYTMRVEAIEREVDEWLLLQFGMNRGCK